MGTCSKCSGRGEMEETRRCGYCNGRGWVKPRFFQGDDSKEDCPKCDGYGSITTTKRCSNCGGSGET